MRIGTMGILCLMMLAACSEPVQDRRMVNERLFGTVVSVNRVQDVNWGGVGNIASAGTGRMATGQASQLSSAADSRLGTQGILSSVTGLFTHGINTGVSTGDVSPKGSLAYVIETDEGQRLEVRASERRVYYPGDEVMVVRNQMGYSEIFPRNLSGRHPGGL